MFEVALNLTTLNDLPICLSKITVTSSLGRWTRWCVETPLTLGWLPQIQALIITTMMTHADKLLYRCVQDVPGGLHVHTGREDPKLRLHQL